MTMIKNILVISLIATLVPTVMMTSVSDNYKSVLGQSQQQFQNYQNHALGVSLQYPSDWKLQEESDDKLRFIKQEGFVTADLNVEDLDQSESSLSEYANTRVNELRTQRPEFQLVSNEPITISNKPAQKVVYTFEREEDGETNKVMRIWSTNEDRLYTLAYIAESGQYDRYLPAFQKMVDTFRISDNSSGSSTTQSQSSDSSREVDNGSGNCDPSYPNVCIKSPPPQLNCDRVPYKNFQVIGADPHGFDGDNDGIGCESAGGGSNGNGNCDRISYPDPNICIPIYPPDLNCPDISYTNFEVTGSDPHGFDRDNDGIGCESTEGGGVTPPGNGDGTPPNGDCDPSYPDVCIRSPPPDLNCPDITDKNFRVTGSDPHGFDRDNDGIGCELANEDMPTPEPGNGDGCVEVDGYLLSKGSYLDERKRIVGSPCDPVEFCSDVGSTDPTVRDHCMDIWLDFDCDDPGMENDPRCIDGDRNPCYPDPTSPECITRTPTLTPTDICYLPGIGDWWDNPDCREYLEDKYKNMNKSPPPSPSPPTPPQCAIDDSGNEVCPPTDGLTPFPEPPTPEPTTTPTPVPTPNVLARGVLPNTPSPTLDNPCEAIPESDIPECNDLPAEISEPTSLPPTPESLLNFPTEEIEEFSNVPLEDIEEKEVEEEEPKEESGGNDEASSGN